MDPNEIDQKLIDFLYGQGYCSVIPIPGRGLCGLQYAVLDEWDLVYGLTWYGVTGRYGYKNLAAAMLALYHWNGGGDPPGNWAVHKGQGFKIKNPLYDKKL